MTTEVKCYIPQILLYHILTKFGMFLQLFLKLSNDMVNIKKTSYIRHKKRLISKVFIKIKYKIKMFKATYVFASLI